MILQFYQIIMSNHVIIFACCMELEHKLTPAWQRNIFDSKPFNAKDIYKKITNSIAS